MGDKIWINGARLYILFTYWYPALSSPSSISFRPAVRNLSSLMSHRKALGKKILLSVLFSEEPELNYLERATTYIPRVPPQSWQFALYKYCISVYIATKIRQKREHTVIPSLLTKARATELKETRREAWSNCEECIFTLLC